MPHIDTQWLLLLAALPALIWFQRRRRLRPAVRFSSLESLKSLPPTTRARWRSAPFWIRIVIIGMLALAIMRPNVGARQVRKIGRGAAIQIVIDRSNSMGSKYDSTTMFEATKELAKIFIRSRGSDLIGAVAFARAPRTISPLTFDHDALIRRISRLDIAPENEYGSNIGGALALAAARIKAADLGRASRVLVLLTDGQMILSPSLLETGSLISSWGIRVHVIHFGSGTPLSFGARNRRISVSDGESQLRRMTEQTGGTYSKARDVEALKRAGAAIDALEPEELPSVQLAGGSEIFPYLLLGALMLLALEVYASTSLFRVIP